MSSVRQLHYSYEEYLRTLDISTVKLEYCGGEIYGMAGRTPAHAHLAAVSIHLLMRALGSNCQVFTSDLKVRIEATDLSTFPDVTVVCGPRRTADGDPNSVTNPTLLVEVTSRSTEDYDRGEKLRHYKELESLKAVLFVSHDAARVTIVERAGAEWTERQVHAGQEVVLADPALSFTLDELYRGVQLDA